MHSTVSLGARATSSSSWVVGCIEGHRECSIFLRLAVELAGKYALVGIYCLFRQWAGMWVINRVFILGCKSRSFISVSLIRRSFSVMNKEELAELLAKSQESFFWNALIRSFKTLNSKFKRIFSLKPGKKG